MNMFSRNLDLELLRTFVAVVDGGGFTRAAERLHRTQSTISQQLKRLEDRLETPLLQRNTRSVTLTERGELLLGYARRLLSLNDEALSALAETQLQGRVRLGASQEVADGGLADLLAHFSRLHPGVALEIRVDANLKMRDEVERGELDLAVVFQDPGQNQSNGIGCEVIETLRRVWVASPDLSINADEPLPLILSNGPCIFRNAVLGALDAISRPWRIVLTTPSLSGMRAALRAGLGVGVRSDRWLEADLRVLDRELPPLPDVELVMLSAADTGEVVVEKLREALREALRLPAQSRSVNS
ncbi:MAG: LysR substrate-binding domain-containing protein [Chromatiales bacterium]|jgi:DNA-binding transcriptional LysR family regulator